MPADDTKSALSLGTSLASLAAGAVALDPLSTAAAIGDLVQSLQAYTSDRRARLLRRLLDEAYFANTSDEGAYAEFKAMFEGGESKSESSKAVFIDTVRAAETVVDEAVLPGLAMAMREYQREGRRPDGFFRGWTRTLMDLSGTEYAALHVLSRALAQRMQSKGYVLVRERAVRLHVDYIGPASAQPVPGKVVIASASKRSPGSLRVEVPDCHGLEAERIFHLFDANGLARFVASSERLAIEMPPATAERIARLLRCWS